MQTNQFGEAISSIPGIVDKYLDHRMNEAVKVAVRIQSDRLRDEAQAENEDFLKKLDENIQKIIKDQVKEQVKTSHAVADELSELEPKKIQFDKIESTISLIPGIIDKYLDHQMNEAMKVAVRLQSDRFQDKAQVENEKFLNKLNGYIQKIIKEQVKEQVKVQVTKILPKIEKTVNEQVEAEVLTRSSNSSKTSHVVAVNLYELELKKILINKMVSNKSIYRLDEQKNLYKALVDAYECEKLILDTYGDTVTLKRRQDDEDKDKEPFVGSNRGSNRRRARKEPAFDHRLKTLETKFLKFMQTNQFAKAISLIPGIVDKYLDHRMNEAVKIIKEQVKEQVKVQVSKILPMIENTVNEQLKAKVLTRSSNSSKTSHAVATNLSELEPKKILIDKIESNKSIHRSDDQNNPYKALVDAYECDKLILDTCGDTVTLKRHQDDEDKDEEPSAESNRESKRRRAGKEPESTKNEEFLNKLDENIQKIIKEQVKEQVKTSHAVAINLSELELKKILIDKMVSNKSIYRLDEQKNLYKPLVDAYECEKLILDTYGDTVTLKRCRDDKDKDKNPSLDQTGGPREEEPEKNQRQPVHQRKRHLIQAKEQAKNQR
nr:hypothetical protein [Tanacetum cinerariifolium]